MPLFEVDLGGGAILPALLDVVLLFSGPPVNLARASARPPFAWDPGSSTSLCSAPISASSSNCAANSDRLPKLGFNIVMGRCLRAIGEVVSLPENLRVAATIVPGCISRLRLFEAFFSASALAREDELGGETSSAIMRVGTSDDSTRECYKIWRNSGRRGLRPIKSQEDQLNTRRILRID
jgi:hypothetical protein